MNVPLGVGRDIQLVRHQDHGNARFTVEPLENSHNLETGAGIESAGGFVGQNNSGTVDQGAGNLLDTAQAFVENSSAGHFAEELDHLLHVGTKEPLLRLVQHERVAREPVDGLYLYCSMNPVLRKRQLLARHVLQAEPTLATGLVKAEVVSDELKAAIILFSSMLDEKQRRLYAGLESLKLGYGGDQRIAECIGMDPHTVAKGRRELVEQDLAIDRIRKAGGGRKTLEKKRPKSSPESKN